jgi:hypothetical protein
MARPRLPTALLELRGGFKNRPSRREARENEPICPEPLPDAPRGIAKPIALAYREMKERGSLWLRSPDQFLVHIAAFYMARYRSGECSSAETSLLIKVLNMIGFSPSERRKLNLPTQTT